MIIEDENNIVRIIMALRYVPEGSQVTKRTGDKLYTVHDTFTVYGLTKATNQTLRADSGTRFLADGKTINAMSGDTQVVLHIDRDTLINELTQEYGQ